MSFGRSMCDAVLKRSVNNVQDAYVRRLPLCAYYVCAFFRTYAV